MGKVTELEKVGDSVPVTEPALRDAVADTSHVTVWLVEKDALVLVAVVDLSIVAVGEKETEDVGVAVAVWILVKVRLAVPREYEKVSVVLVVKVSVERSVGVLENENDMEVLGDDVSDCVLVAADAERNAVRESVCEIA
jgi:hypothetical protein